MGLIRDLHGVTVLAVDDIEDNLDLIEEYLDGEVWAVHRAHSGEEALSLAAEHEPDVILLDLMMPNMNGFAVLRAIRASETLKDTPVILQTAYSEADNIITARRAGCDHFLCKPLAKQRLLAEIRKCLDVRPRRPRRAPDDPNEPSPSERMRDLTTALADSRDLAETARLADEAQTTESLDCFRKLIPGDSPIGLRLIRLADSPAYGSRRPASTVTEVIVRIGARKTRRLIQKAASGACGSVGTRRILRALELLETLCDLFPSRTTTSDGILSLLEELSAAAGPGGAPTAKASPGGLATATRQS